MAASVPLAGPVISSGDVRFPSIPGCRVQLSNLFLHGNHKNLLLNSIRPANSKVSTCKRGAIVQAAYGRDSGRPSSASIFVGGFVLGGLIVGTLGCVFAPQISKALTAADRKDLMRKLPKFIYDEEKALEKTRKILAEKIEQLNSAIDDVSSQLRADDKMNGASVAGDEVEAMI